MNDSTLMNSLSQGGDEFRDSAVEKNRQSVAKFSVCQVIDIQQAVHLHFDTDFLARRSEHAQQQSLARLNDTVG